MAKIEAVKTDFDERIHHLEMLDQQGRFALDCIERWSLVAAIPDGEDSAGRQRLRLATPEELVDRSFTTAKLAFERARQEGLTIDMTPWNSEGHETPAMPSGLIFRRNSTSTSVEDKSSESVTEEAR